MRGVDNAVRFTVCANVAGGGNNDGALFFGAAECRIKPLPEFRAVGMSAQCARDAGDHGDVDDLRAKVEGAVDGGGEGFEGAAVVVVTRVGAGLSDADDGGVRRDAHVVIRSGGSSNETSNNGAMAIAVVEGVVFPEEVGTGVKPG